MNCSPILYETKFIDIDLTKTIHSGMSINEVTSIIGEPNYIEIQTDEMENQFVVHYYYIRDKVYRNSTIPQSDNVISKNNTTILTKGIVGYGNEKKFKLYFQENILFQSKVEY